MQNGQVTPVQLCQEDHDKLRGLLREKNRAQRQFARAGMDLADFLDEMETKYNTHGGELNTETGVITMPAKPQTAALTPSEAAGGGNGS